MNVLERPVETTLDFIADYFYEGFLRPYMIQQNEEREVYV